MIGRQRVQMFGWGLCTLALPLAAASTSGCVSRESACEDKTIVRELDLQEAPSSLGYSAVNVLQRHEGAYEEDLRWFLVEKTDVMLQLSIDQEPSGKVFLVSDPCGNEGLEIEIRLTASTDDGRLDESWSTTLQTLNSGGPPDWAGVEVRVLPEEFNGSLELQEDAEYATMTVELQDRTVGGRIATLSCADREGQSSSSGTADGAGACVRPVIARFGRWIDLVDD